MIEVLPRILLYRAFRRWNWPRLLPMNLTASITYRCNSRCRTCNVWKKRSEELSLEEWGRIFAGLGRTPYWITFSGGEPLLRADVVEIVERAYESCRPAIINIPTNGLLPSLIVKRIAAIVERCFGSQIIVNLSLDGWGDQHDAIRGVQGNFRRAMETYRELQSMSASNLTLGIHTVISQYNVDAIPTLYEHVRTLSPDSYITEIAEERVELDTVDSGITPSPEDYARAIQSIRAQLLRIPLHGIARVTQAFRLRYYDLVQAWLREQRQIIPCYAGWASAQISPEGDVWFCCVRAEPVGNLRETNYDFRRVWFSEQAVAMRRTVKDGACHCPLANAAYTNMLCHYPSLVQAGLTLFGSGLRPGRPPVLFSDQDWY
jgi:MoaA/NifB/PqqE/SkfB family radical SAM enzyme